MVKPVLQSVAAFDKNDGNTFSFTSIGGDQIFGNRLTIVDNATNSIVYQEYITSFQYSHTLPSTNNLVNGNYYMAHINTYGVDGDVSGDSNTIQFYCYTNPTVEITNFPSSGVIGRSSFSANITYTQPELETLDSLIVNVYDIQNNLVSTSGKIYQAIQVSNVISYLIEELMDGETYNIQVVGTTTNGTVVESQVYRLLISYAGSTVPMLFQLENNCANGYIDITGRIKVIDGESNSSGVEFDEYGDVILLNPDDYIEWDDGVTIENDFVVQIWMTPVQTGGFCDLKKDDSTKYVFSLVREIPYGETEPKDYITVTGYINGVETMFMKSNIVDPINNVTRIMIWFKKVGDTYELVLTILNDIENYIDWNVDSNVEYGARTNLSYNAKITSRDSVIEWNGYSNLEYGMITNIEYDEPYTNYGVQKDDFFGSMDEVFDINSVKIYNGRFSGIYITEDTRVEYNEEQPDKTNWDDNTRLNCDFDYNLNGGNTNYLLSQVSLFRIKRRMVGTHAWITVYEFNDFSDEYFTFSAIDTFAPSGVEFEYAIVPVGLDGTESAYTIDAVKSLFNAVFVTDASYSYKIDADVSISRTRVVSSNKFETLGSRVPIVVRNSNVNYEEGSVTGKLLGGFSKTRELDRFEVVSDAEEFIDFITNGEVKIIKDFNGNICLCDIIDNVTNTNSLVNKTTEVSFSYVEQGKYDNESDLFEYGFLEVM